MTFPILSETYFTLSSSIFGSFTSIFLRSNFPKYGQMTSRSGTYRLPNISKKSSTKSLSSDVTGRINRMGSFTLTRASIGIWNRISDTLNYSFDKELKLLGREFYTSNHYFFAVVLQNPNRWQIVPILEIPHHENRQLIGTETEFIQVRLPFLQVVDKTTNCKSRTCEFR